MNDTVSLHGPFPNSVKALTFQSTYTDPDSELSVYVSTDVPTDTTVLTELIVYFISYPSSVLPPKSAAVVHCIVILVPEILYAVGSDN